MSSLQQRLKLSKSQPHHAQSVKKKAFEIVFDNKYRDIQFICFACVGPSLLSYRKAGKFLVKKGSNWVDR